MICFLLLLGVLSLLAQIVVFVKLVLDGNGLIFLCIPLIVCQADFLLRKIYALLKHELERRANDEQR